jgi:hypothetical protein
MVDRFQAGEIPVFVISVKAGGTGLNLTQATHVIHYDRWWNPAVEDQASDRAWRIGQDRPVQVHRMVCEGTVEDRISAMLADKRAIAGEGWCRSGRRRPSVLWPGLNRCRAGAEDSMMAAQFGTTWCGACARPEARRSIPTASPGSHLCPPDRVARRGGCGKATAPVRGTAPHRSPDLPPTLTRRTAAAAIAPAPPTPPCSTGN